MRNGPGLINLLVPLRSLFLVIFISRFFILIYFNYGDFGVGIVVLIDFFVSELGVGIFVLINYFEIRVS